uniref:Xpo1 domain-containing protein n=3 Tax=Caenorhabditis tropicalis TaxID=1561998 RepID=A0A1I7TNN7_9PELO
MASGAISPEDTELLIAAIDKFYTTSDEEQRHTLEAVLYYECAQTIVLCMQMISQPTSSSNVRIFGAHSLYDVIRKRSDECTSNQTLQLSLKTFLIESLTSGTYSQTTAVLNKLTSSLGLFTLYCVPDLWTTPVEDLTGLLAGTPEILMKVLSDIAGEFSFLLMPLSQRNTLKSELHKFSKSIIQVIAVVLRGGDTSSITKQAAVECVEQWLRLPGMTLDEWTPVLSDVLGAVVEDCTALASILDLLAENDEFQRNTTLIMYICQFICIHVSKKIEEELCADPTSEEVAALISATCLVATKSISTLVESAVQAGNTELIIRIAQVMQVISNIQGQYPQQELISDLPSWFFVSLRVELISMIKSEPKINEQFLGQLAQIYAHMLGVSILKLAYPEFNTWQMWNLEDRDQFEAYRLTRSEVCYDSYSFAATDTLSFLNEQLGGAVNGEDINRGETCLYLWQCVADYLSESDYPCILKCLEICARLSFPSSGPIDQDVDRRGGTMLRLLYSLSHLIQSHDQANELECVLFPVILSYVSPSFSSVREALSTLEKYSVERTESLVTFGDQISETCYNFFKCHSAKESDRLAALKCVGYVLSIKPPSETMTIIGQILSGQNINEPGIDAATIYFRYSFQIKIFSVLFSCLENKKGSETRSTIASTNEEPTIVKLFREAIPVFEALCSGDSGLDQNNTGNLIQEVCKAVRVAIISLPDQYLPHFFPFVASLLNSALFAPASVKAAAGLAKATVLQCGSVVGIELANMFSQWVQLFERHIESPHIEEYLQLVYQVVKKNWKMIRRFHDPSIVAFRSAIRICSQTISSSDDTAAVRCSAQILATFSAFIMSNGDSEMKAIFAEEGQILLRTVFGRIQRELIRSTVESLSDILYFYFKEFTTETKAFIMAEPYGESALVTAMFREIGNPRNFRQQTIRFNLAAVRSPI